MMAGDIVEGRRFPFLTMTLLFDQHQRAESSFTVKSIPEQGGLDTVLVGRELLALLCTSVTDRLFLSITSKERPIQTISCWAALDETVRKCSTFHPALH
jgi:hypothetical protein